MEVPTKEKKKTGMNKTKAQKLIQDWKRATSNRTNWESYWQDLHDYFYITSPDVNKAYYPGTELETTNLYDATTLEAADVLASGFMNYLTPPTSKWFKLRAKNPQLEDNKRVNKFLADVADEVYHTLNKSNFYDRAFPSYKGSGVYGTSILLEEEDIDETARFYSLPLKQTAIIEDAKGRIAKYFIEFEYTAFQAATRWGKEALSEKMRQQLDGPQSNKKHKFLLYIAKRNVRDVTKENKENLPIEATWIDVASAKTMEESGYNEFPAMTHRFDKRPSIPWGFSPGMKALPSGRLLNGIAKTNLRALMKRTDPPVALPDNAFIMPFNSNPRALNYYKKNALDSAKDIFSFANFGDPQAGMTGMEYYGQQIRSIMFNDVFLAFQNLTKQMNNPEVMERINEKMSMLGPAVGRYTGEVLNPIVIRTIGILARRGKLPPMPEELIENPEFEIDYVSQLAQAQKRSELNSLMSGLSLVGQMSEAAPETLDKIDPDKTVDEAWDILGAPVKVLRSDQEVQDIREMRVQQQQEMMQQEQLANLADTGKKAAEADKALAEAKTKGKRQFE